MSDPSPLSLNRLRDAFAAMLRPPDEEGSRAEASPRDSIGRRREADSPDPWPDPVDDDDRCKVGPRAVVEAMLFVGRPDNGPMSARELAAALRGVSPAEVDAAVAELNAIYERDAAPYEITGSSSGYRLALRKEFVRVRDKFFGRIRESRLSPAALEVLAVVAYNQPTTLAEIDRLRGRPSGAVLASLVRRQLVRQERNPDDAQPAHYLTTERFLRLFGLESVAALPRNEELSGTT
jgi:segregation and condensation protein B